MARAPQSWAAILVLHEFQAGDTAREGAGGQSALVVGALGADHLAQHLAGIGEPALT